MRIAFIGQQDFGKAVLEAFLKRGDEVAGVFCAPEKPGAKPDVLRLAAEEKGLKVFQFPSLKSAEAEAAMGGLSADIGIMAYVLQFAPQSFVNIPKHGTIQYHPSLLPRFRGPSSINWPIARGELQTGLTIFRPTDGLDEGPVILQKSCPIGAHATLGDIYFENLFPMGVEAMLEAADLVVAGQHVEIDQEEDAATYEGWFRAAEAEIRWSSHAEQIYNLIRAANPAPGAWTTVDGKKLQIFDSRLQPVRRLSEVKGKPGEVIAVDDDGFSVCAQGGQIRVSKVKAEGGKKVSAADYAREVGLSVGQVLGR
ncbi:MULTISPECIES: methionyl-tRNA formyltransferase [Methylobacterium]|uniref:Methionyl-tRNA formyltransferase n=1 Tax=Methylobacterium longum TaxID=767694 RepID=A0ABT8ALC4_9HYPH|nr:MULTISPECIES: methionyl-tRNA formyltransferase [Methylobacterium]MCJ2101583.1 methionyl-tRNA formyltransferase [Methylobacterium sp. E-046]MDN3570712.1 methionyl-tRNA formyltransferase [Methylobacterium longum]GJE09855.1 Methionyl-tRNA formyltransferase [Methylobacterium longum]